jgi:hypothetical protein
MAPASVSQSDEGVMSENDWQPMDTAPKDGTDVLLYCRYDYRPNGGRLIRDIEVGSWADPWDEFAWISHDLRQLEPVAWRPLPLMPSEDEA